MFLLLLSTAFAEDAWLTGEAEMLRWTDGDPVVVKALTSGAKVEIVYEEEALVRVRSGIDFGWVPAELLTTEVPEDAILPAGGLLDGLNLGGAFGLPGAPPSALLGGAPIIPPSSTDE